MHNYGGSDVTGDVLVRFYAGDPDNGGVEFGSATISGGIPHGSSRTATYSSYTISGVDVYAKVDPSNSIQESDESNNKAYRNPLGLDSDNDGLTDDEEMDGMRTQYGLMYTDPYEADTDGDGLSDSAELGPRQYDAYGACYYLSSYPDNADSDDDGLSDYEEKQGFTVYLADSHDRAVSFWNAVSQGNDPVSCLNPVPAGSLRLNADTDGDGLNDGDEIWMGTRPDRMDSDTDGIRDNLELGYCEDPTVFDLSPPVIESDVIVTPHPIFIVDYDVSYRVTDYGGVKSVSVLKDDVVKQSQTYPDRVTFRPGSASFSTDWVDTIVDEFQATRVDILVSDWHGNSDVDNAYVRSSMYGQFAYALTGSNNIFGAPVAMPLGTLSGATSAFVEVPELAVQIVNDPVGYYSSIQSLANSIINDQALMADLVASLPQSVHEQQENENPYDVDPNNPNPEILLLHDSYMTGWYARYIAGQIALSLIGAEALKAVTSSAQFAQLSSGVLSKMDNITAALRASKALRVVDEMGLMLADDMAMLGPGAPGVLDNVPTGVKKAHVSEKYGDISSDKRVALNGKEQDLGEFICTGPGHALDLVNTMQVDSLIKMFSLDSGRLSSNSVTKFRTQLLELRARNVPPEIIETFSNDVYTLRNVNGIEVLVNEKVTGKLRNFRGPSYDAHFAASKINTIQYIERQVKSTSGDLIGEIDVVSIENNKIIGYECKDRNYNTWSTFRDDMVNLKLKYDRYLKTSNDNTIPNEYKLDEYHVVFKQNLPIEEENWLRSQDINFIYYQG